MRPVAGFVVCLYVSDRDAEVHEPCIGAVQNAAAVSFCSSSSNSLWASRGVRIDNGVQEVLSARRAVEFVEYTGAAIGARVSPARRTAELAPSAAGGELAKFLDIGVDQVAGPGRWAFPPPD